MTLKEELDALRPLMGTESGEFYSRVKHIADTYTSEGDKKMIADFMDECLNGISENHKITASEHIRDHIVVFHCETLLWQNERMAISAY